jgi:ECF transporter S component (folate family)
VDNKNKTKRLVTVALLIAMQIVLARVLSIQLPQIRLSFEFIPLAAIAVLYGPVYAGLAIAVADTLGWALYPTGPYFPGFLVSAVLTGVTYGLFLHKRGKDDKIALWRVISAAFVATVLLQLMLDTLWVSILIGVEYTALFPWRLVRTLIMFPVQVVFLRFLTGERFRAVIAR